MRQRDLEAGVKVIKMALATLGPLARHCTIYMTPRQARALATLVDQYLLNRSKVGVSDPEDAE